MVASYKCHLFPSRSSATQHYLHEEDENESEAFRLHNSQLQAMLKRLAHSLGLKEHTEKDSTRKNHPKGRTKVPSEYSLRSRDFVVRIIHAGGQQEVYQHAVPASELMAKYPGKHVARPEVFRNPHHSVLWPDDHLLPGHKYIIISSRDVEKLKRKHPEQSITKEPNGVVAKDIPSTKINKSPKGHQPIENGKMKVPNGVAGNEIEESVSPSGCKIKENDIIKEAKELGEEKVESEMDQSLGESFYFAKDFYEPKKSRRKRIKGKKPFVPPLPVTRSYRGLGWQPSLPTVKELSP